MLRLSVKLQLFTKIMISTTGSYLSFFTGVENKGTHNLWSLLAGYNNKSTQALHNGAVCYLWAWWPTDFFSPFWYNLIFSCCKTFMKCLKKESQRFLCFRSDETQAASFFNNFKNIPHKAWSFSVKTVIQIVIGKY